MGILIITVIDDGGAAAAAAVLSSNKSTTSSSSSQQPRRQCEHRCEIARLVQHIPRLRAAIADVPPGQDCRVTVHADLSTFSWIMAWVKAQQLKHTEADGQSASGDVLEPLLPEPVLEPGNVVPLLLASSFLRMRPLVRACVEYAATHLAAAPAHQLLALRAGLLAKLAGAASEEALEALLAHAEQQQHCRSSATSPAGHELLAQQLFQHKLSALLQQHATTLQRCLACGSVFSAAARTQLVCCSSTGRQAGHTADPSWDLPAFLQQQRSAQQPRSWRDLFWLVWGTVTILHCQACGALFPAREQDSCRFHPHAAVFASEAAPGCHPCCGAPAWRPGVPRDLRGEGCCCRPHDSAEVSAAGPPGSVLQLLARFSALVSRPWPQQQPDGGADVVTHAEQQQQQQQVESQEGGSALPLLVALVSRPADGHHARHSCPLHAVPAVKAPQTHGSSSTSSTSASTSSSLSDDTSSDSETSSSTPTSTDGDSDADTAGSNACACGRGLVSSSLGSLVAEVRTAVTARSRHTGLGASAAAASGNVRGPADARMSMPVGVALPLAETFSAGGRRVLQAARRHHQEAAAPGMQQGGGGAGRSAVPVMTRSRLLQLLLAEDSARMTGLMQHLDALRSQPLPADDAVRPSGEAAAAASTGAGSRASSLQQQEQQQRARKGKKTKKKRGTWLPV